MPEIDPRERHLLYEPAPSRPHDFDRQLKRIVGRCPTGETYLRFSWGMDVTEILDGNLIRRYPDPEGKYVGLNRWVLEGWQNPEVYNEAQWRANEDLLGPYPTSGVWDFIAVVEDEQKRYLGLGSHALQMARDWRHWRSKSTSRVLADLVKERCKTAFLKEQRWERRKKEILEGFQRDFIDELGGGRDTRKKTQIGKISKGEYQQTATGMLIPKLA